MREGNNLVKTSFSTYWPFLFLCAILDFVGHFGFCLDSGLYIRVDSQFSEDYTESEKIGCHFFGPKEKGGNTLLFIPT